MITGVAILPTAAGVMLWSFWPAPAPDHLEYLPAKQVSLAEAQQPAPQAALPVTAEKGKPLFSTLAPRPCARRRKPLCRWWAIGSSDRTAVSACWLSIAKNGARVQTTADIADRARYTANATPSFWTTSSPLPISPTRSLPA